jgi:glutamate-1-semialdehyde 2,1-aminomutase
MFTIFFRETVPTNFTQVSQCDMAAFGRFHRAALKCGVYLPPSQYEAAFLPSSMTEKELEHLVSGIQSALAEA